MNDTSDLVELLQKIVAKILAQNLRGIIVRVMAANDFLVVAPTVSGWSK